MPPFKHPHDDSQDHVIHLLHKTKGLHRFGVRYLTARVGQRFNVITSNEVILGRGRFELIGLIFNDLIDLDFRPAVF